VLPPGHERPDLERVLSNSSSGLDDAIEAQTWYSLNSLTPLFREAPRMENAIERGPDRARLPPWRGGSAIPDAYATNPGQQLQAEGVAGVGVPGGVARKDSGGESDSPEQSLRYRGWR